MIKIKDLQKLIESSILTGYLKNERKTNFLIIAESESGKSELIKVGGQYKNAFITNKLSYKPLVDKILPRVENKEISHILIPDFISILGSKRASDNLIPALNNFMEEGIENLSFYGSERNFKNPIKGGILTAITKKEFEKHIIKWRDTGFLSRFLTITYCYSDSTVTQIHKFIEKNKHIDELKKHKNMENIDLNSISVDIPSEISERINIIADQLVRNNKNYIFQKKRGESWQNWEVKINNYGFRLHKQLRALIKGICLFNSELKKNKTNYKVTTKDFEDLNGLTKFLNFSYTEI